MGMRFNITVVRSTVDESDAIQRINAWLDQRGFFGLVPLSPEANRNMVVGVFSGANRGSAAPDGFTTFLSTLFWDLPQEVVVVIHPDDEMIEGGMLQVEVWRPKREAETTEAVRDAR